MRPCSQPALKGSKMDASKVNVNVAHLPWTPDWRIRLPSSWHLLHEMLRRDCGRRPGPTHVHRRRAKGRTGALGAQLIALSLYSLSPTAAASAAAGSGTAHRHPSCSVTCQIWPSALRVSSKQTLVMHRPAIAASAHRL